MRDCQALAEPIASKSPTVGHLFGAESLARVAGAEQSKLRLPPLAPNSGLETGSLVVRALSAIAIGKKAVAVIYSLLAFPRLAHAIGNHVLCVFLGNLCRVVLAIDQLKDLFPS
jgi:hypothetical protein